MDTTQSIISPAIGIQSFIYHYRGYWNDGGKCNVDFIPDGDNVPLLIVTERKDNKNTSVTNMCEYLAYELLAKLYPQAFTGAPFWYMEVYEDHPEEKSLVTFDSVVPSEIFLGGVMRKKLGKPTWKPVKPVDMRDAKMCLI